jgi:hypothetical protein
MKNRPLYENLDTSFVNLSSLLRFLRRKEFVGNLRVELKDYEADIILSGENQIKARERDRKSGRISEGEDALQRILVRAREAGGIVHVYESAGEIEQTAEKTPIFDEAFKPDISFLAENPNSILSIPAQIPQRKIAAENFSETRRNTAPKDFPFELSNRVEDKARQNQISAEQWNEFLALTGELLTAVDESLARENLDFTAAFQKACAEISADYPFLDPNSQIFAYKKGAIEMREHVNVKVFAAAINEALRRILEKLDANPKFDEVRRETSQKLIALVYKNKSLYDRFFITPRLEKTLGI